LEQPPSACGIPLEKDATIAVSRDYIGPGKPYQCGDQYYIESYGDKKFTITDTGTFPDKNHFDVFVGEQYHNDFYTNYSKTGIKERVAKVEN
jgi:3D (Asp-Asp-Asp) domain-containing protein